MLLQEITDEKDLKDGRTYLCCRSSRHGNAIWEALEAQKNRFVYQGLSMQKCMTSQSEWSISGPP